jgi:hypothetical protein
MFTLGPYNVTSSSINGLGTYNVSPQSYINTKGSGQTIEKIEIVNDSAVILLVSWQGATFLVNATSVLDLHVNQATCPPVEISIGLNSGSSGVLYINVYQKGDPIINVNPTGLVEASLPSNVEVTDPELQTAPPIVATNSTIFYLNSWDGAPSIIISAPSSGAVYLFGWAIKAGVLASNSSLSVALGASTNMYVSWVNSGIYDVPLSIDQANFQCITSPLGAAFNQALNSLVTGASISSYDHGTDAAHGAITPTTGWTVEFWISLPSFPGTNLIYRNNEYYLGVSSAGIPYFLWYNESNTAVSIAGSSAISGMTALAASINSSGDVYLYANGVQVNSIAGQTFIAPVSNLLYIGDYKTPANTIIDEVRISNVTRYTASYTPQSAPFATDVNTSALFHLDGVLADTFDMASMYTTDDISPSSLSKGRDYSHPMRLPNGLYAFTNDILNVSTPLITARYALGS